MHDQLTLVTLINTKEFSVKRTCLSSLLKITGLSLWLKLFHGHATPYLAIMTHVTHKIHPPKLTVFIL